ncbi:SET domain-containing protein-lysine N-methyltransferase [Vibrio sp. 10N.261.51.C6]|uniref:SET domain-containing protein-lysine N-methyltransferase n=1 Tax=Vibrio sp. 10N.261.51.C6 TaxID=3229676 RepID=UPI00355266F9
MNSVTNDIDFVVNNTVDNLNPTFISRSSTHGFGLFAKGNISKGNSLGTLDGQRINLDSWEKIKYNIKEDIKDYYDYFFMECNYLEESVVLVRPLRTKYSYINHHRVPNLEIENNSLSIVAVRDINDGEELFLDYRMECLPEIYVNGIKGDYL